MKGSVRERLKGLATKRRIFEVNHGNWVDVLEVACAANIHKTTALRELHNLRMAGLMEAERRGKSYFFRAIKPIETEITLEMFLTTREIDAFHKDVAESRSLKIEKFEDHSWRPEIVQKWGGYRVMGAAA